MAEVKTETIISAPVEVVWKLLADHAGYTRFPLVSDCRLIQPGTEEQNGKGAVRLLSGLMINIEQEVIYYEEPTRMDFHIRDCSIPMEHQYESIRITPEGDDTRVLWISRFEVNIPLAGPVLGNIAGTVFHQLYGGILSGVKKEAESYQ